MLQFNADAYCIDVRSSKYNLDSNVNKYNRVKPNSTNSQHLVSYCIHGQSEKDKVKQRFWKTFFLGFQLRSVFFLFFFVGYPHEDSPIEGHPGNLTILLSSHFISNSLVAQTNINAFFIPKHREGLNPPGDTSPPP